MTLNEYIATIDRHLDSTPPFPDRPERPLAWAAWWATIEHRNRALEPLAYERPLTRNVDSKKSEPPQKTRREIVCPSPVDTVSTRQGSLKF